MNVPVIKCNPMNEFPTQVEGEDFSKTVLVYDADLEDFDLGYYNYDTKNWEVMGCFQMKLICWSEIPLPHKLVVGNFKPYLTN